MPAPRMVIVAGPSGGGKSSIFRIFQLQIDALGTDLRAATLLGQAMGADKPVFQPASAAVSLYMQFRQQAGQEMELFIKEHIDRRKSFAFETSLRDNPSGTQLRSSTPSPSEWVPRRNDLHRRG